MSKKKQSTSPLGKLLKRSRRSQGMTMKALGAAVGVSESYISLLESGQRSQPSRELTLKIAQTLGANSFNNLADDFLVTAGFYPTNKQTYHQHQDTLQNYRNQLQQSPNDFESFSSLVFALIKLGETEEAQSLIQNGLTQFSDTIRLQSLLASLELSKQNFQKALDFQVFALSQFPPSEEASSQEAQRLKINLGVIHFLKAVDHQSRVEQSEEKVFALTHFNQAKELFKEALLLAPDNIYVLDEYARVLFNLAYLGDDLDETKALWDECIQYMTTVIQSEQKYMLGQTALIEACVFLAHAYSKTKRFEQAQTLIGFLEITMTSPHWLVPYVKACFYNLRGVHSQVNTDFDEALKYLQLAKEYAPDVVKTQATVDPDLNILRQKKEKEFKDIIS